MLGRGLAGLVVATLCVTGSACGSKGEQGAAPAASDAGPGVLSIGASLSLSGSLAREGILTQEGYDVCQKVVNDKGGVDVGGRRFRLDIQYQDDLSKPDTAGQLVDQFNDRGVKLILGPYGSATTEAAAAVIERNGQVMADSSGADDKIFAKGYHRTFAVLSPARAYAASMVQALVELAEPRPHTVAFLSADDGFSKTVTQGGMSTARVLGMEIVAEEYVPNGTSDVSGALTKIKPRNPDVIMVSAHLAEGVATVKQAAELGISPAWGFAETVAPPTPDFVSTLGAGAEGVIGSTQWTVKTAGEDKWFGTAPDYNNTFKAQFGGREPEYHGAEGTAACLALVLSAEKAGSVAPDAVRDAMAGLDQPSFFGPLKFTPEGQNMTKAMSVIQIQDGRPKAVWPADSAEAPLRRQPGTGG
jgi:branched-chain amino acid transport system substrate-binding protein